MAAVPTAPVADRGTGGALGDDCSFTSVSITAGFPRDGLAEVRRSYERGLGRFPLSHGRVLRRPHGAS